MERGGRGSFRSVPKELSDRGGMGAHSPEALPRGDIRPSFAGLPYPVMKKFLLAPAVAALAMFFWGFVYYGISGLPYRTLETAPNLAASLASLPADGAYLVPDPRSPDAEKAMQEGPVAMVHYRKVPHSMGSVMAMGYLQEFISCLLLAFILWKCDAAFRGYTCRLMLSITIGVLITWFSHAGEAVWWQQAWGWHLSTMFYDIVAWAIAGSVLAKFFTPKPA